MSPLPIGAYKTSIGRIACGEREMKPLLDRYNHEIQMVNIVFVSIIEKLTNSVYVVVSGVPSIARNR